MHFQIKGCLGALTAALVAALLSSHAMAEKRYDRGASDTEIKIGQTWALSGPVASEAYETKVQAAYFERLNEKGGINGRKIRFITLDDGYSPPRTMEQTRKLVEEDGVLFIALPFGSPTNAATQRYLNAAKVPQILVTSGGSRFVDAKTWPWTTAALPAYQREGAIYGRYVAQMAADPASSLHAPKVGILYQNDDFGRDFVKGVKAGMGAKAASLIVKEVSYEPTDPTLDSQLISLKASGANVFMNFTTGRATSLSIRRAYEIGWRPLQILDSPWASIEAVLKPVGLEKSTGIITASYFKEPSDPAYSNEPSMVQFVEFMKKYVPDVNPRSRNAAIAYFDASLLARIIEQSGDDLTRANIIKQATSLSKVASPFLLPGITVNASDSDRDPIKQFQIVHFDGTKWVPQGALLSN
ncbi:ABC transporter substrate-binding protein [Paraburkholderia sp. 40]|uniref:ABC transporter substrate-binding protein n=1 Tax=Paraburkholderia sp. 40 TaxID=2991059 RepID=UPI003D200ADD